MSTTAKRANDDSSGAPAAKRSSTDTATSVVDVDWNQLNFGQPFANKYEGCHIGFGLGDSCCNRSHANFRNKLHIYSRMDICVLQVMNKLGQVFD